MKRRIKLVASVLALALTASPLLASVPCWQAAQTTMQCGTGCPMTVKAPTAKSVGAPESESTDATPSCCKRSSQPAIPPTTQAGPERPLFLGLQPMSATSLAVIPELSEASVEPLGTRSFGARSQASLCTFLI